MRSIKLITSGLKTVIIVALLLLVFFGVGASVGVQIGDVTLGGGLGSGAWLDGRVFSAPVWVGISQGGNVYRFGFNHPQVQNLTQNLVHKVFGCSRYYNDYKFNNFSGYSYIGTNNPFTLWNY